MCSFINMIDYLSKSQVYTYIQKILLETSKFFFWFLSLSKGVVLQADLNIQIHLHQRAYEYSPFRKIQNTEYRIRNTVYRIQNTETEYRIQNTEYLNTVQRFRCKLCKIMIHISVCKIMIHFSV